MEGCRLAERGKKRNSPDAWNSRSCAVPGKATLLSLLTGCGQERGREREMEIEGAEQDNLRCA